MSIDDAGNDRTKLLDMMQEGINHARQDDSIAILMAVALHDGPGWGTYASAIVSLSDESQLILPLLDSSMHAIDSLLDEHKEEDTSLPEIQALVREARKVLDISNFIVEASSRRN